MEVLRFGYRILFCVIPAFSQALIPLPSYSPSSIRGIALSNAVADLQEKGAIEPAPSSPGYYSRLFVTPKVIGGWRPVIDLSRLNRSVLVSHFHMETAQSILQSLRPGDWMVSLDLQDAYLQVPVHPSSRHYLRFCVGDSVLQFRALCSGLSTAPQVFTSVIAPISSIMHCYGFWILRYLDNWLVLGSLFRERVRARDFLLWLCQDLGVQVNLGKSSLTPSQTHYYLEMRLQTRPLRVFPTPKRVLKPSSMLLKFVSCRQQPLLHWRQLLAVMSSLSSIVPGPHLRMRSLQLRLNAAGRLLPDSALVDWDDSCLADLQWWSVESHLLGLPLDLPQPGLALYTDTLDLGWGPFLADDHLSGVWSPEFSCYSINHRELLAVLYGVQGFLPLLRSQSVSLFVDNTTALSYLKNQGGTCSSMLNSVAQAILRFCEVHHICLVPQFVPGHLNVLADSLSHRSQVLGSEWTLCHQAFRELLHLWPATVDLFATVNSSSPSVLLSGGGFAVSGHGRHDAALGRPACLCLPSLRPAASCAVKGLAIQGSGVHPCGSILASAPLVSGSSGASGGCPSVPSTAEGSTQTAPLPSFSPEPPRASSDCISYLERSAHSFRFSSAVARQLARCRRASTRVNYQAK